MPHEFDLISRFFAGHQSIPGGFGVGLGIGDDCALLKVAGGYEIAVTTDSLNEDVHFFKGTAPYFLGRQTLRVNLSDLAAMGAEPWVFTLSLTMPEAESAFLERFSKGLFDVADECGIILIGGNTSKGHLSFTVCAMGKCQRGKSLRRDFAKKGDLVYVTGYLGLCGMYLKVRRDRGAFDPDVLRLERRYYLTDANVRTAFATELCRQNLSRCAIDLSDGISGDLRHVLDMSHAGATLFLEKLPYHEELSQLCADERFDLCLNAGGDYELLFTASPGDIERVEALARKTNTPVTRIGIITEGGLNYCVNGKIDTLRQGGYEHF